jgi:V8-like Glu-specific endopeptidase
MPRTKIVGRWSIACLALASSASSQQAQNTYSLPEILKIAVPAPMPLGRYRAPGEVPSILERATVGIDLRTGQVEVTPPLDPSMAPQGPWSIPPRSAMSPSAPQAEAAIEADATPPTAKALSTATIVPDQVSRVIDPSFVYTAATGVSGVSMLVARFNVGGKDYFLGCSAVPVDSFHLVTAGHCIFNWDPTLKGNPANATWASEIWSWAAQTDRVEPLGVPDYPFGEAKAVYLRSYAGWTHDELRDDDWGVITLDRRVGDHTGYYGLEANRPAQSLLYRGYPGVAPGAAPEAVPNLYQYYGFDFNNVLAYTPERIRLAAYVYPGMSGGPVYRMSSDYNIYLQGVISTTDESGHAQATLLTSSRLADLLRYENDDRSARPPTDRPQLIEYVSSPYAKEVGSVYVTPAGSPGPDDSTFLVLYNVFNAGYADSGPVTVNFYFSEKPSISTADYLVGTLVLPNIPANTPVVAETEVTVPSDLPFGEYYLGWIMSGTVPEYESDMVCEGTPCHSIVVISHKTLAVTYPAPYPPPCVPLRPMVNEGLGLDPVVSPANSVGCPLGSYLPGQVLQLTAAPEAGNMVVDWLGTTNDASTALRNTAVVPEVVPTWPQLSFLAVEYATKCIHVFPDHNGKGIDPAVSPPKSAGCTNGRFVAGQNVHLTAGPGAGYTVGGWTGTANDASTAIRNLVQMPVISRFFPLLVGPDVAVTYDP